MSNFIPDRTKTISKEDLELAYSTYKTARATAKFLGVTHPTVTRLLKKYDIVPTSKEEINRIKADKCRFNDTKAHGQIAKYFRDHKYANLPRSYKAIAKEIGTSYEAVKQYFYRQRSTIKKMIGELPDLRKVDLTIEHDDGGTIHSSFIQDYYYVVDRFTINTVIIIKSKDDHTYRATIPNIRKFLLTARHSGQLELQ